MLSVGGEDILSGVHVRFGTNCFHTRQQSNMSITIQRGETTPHELVMTVTPDTLSLKTIAAPDEFVTFVKGIEGDAIKEFEKETFPIIEKPSRYSNSIGYYFLQLEKKFRNYHWDLVVDELALSTAPIDTRGRVTGEFQFRVTENSGGKISIHIETPVIDILKMKTLDAIHYDYEGNIYQFQGATQEDGTFGGVRFSKGRRKRRSRSRRRRSRRHSTPIRLRR